jgi:soluble lytic murein transglycosylase-like protein
MQNKVIYIIGIIAVMISGAACIIGATYQPEAEPIHTETYYEEPERVTELVVVHEETETAPSTETVTEAVTEAPKESKVYNTILPEWIQTIIVRECESKNIEPEIVMAMIEKESGGDIYAIGDSGRSLGLMQIQPRCHIKRMIKLDSTDLFDAEKNIRVGIDYLAELINIYGDETKALVAYNAGSYNGTVTTYAANVIARANVIGE